MSSTSALPRLKLPLAHHVSRLPTHVTEEQLERVRQAAYNLPQVVKPSDYLPEEAPELETHLDTLGLILLQRAVPHQRPSRWIAPTLIDAALLHLETVGVGRETRALMVERQAMLEALGITRAGDGWERLHRHALKLSTEAWQAPGALTVAYRGPVAADPVWAYFRDGDKARLLQNLGAVPVYPFADDLAAHLDALAERSEWCDAKAMDALLPRLQA